MQTSEYHFVTDSKNALFTDDYLGDDAFVTAIAVMSGRRTAIKG